MSDPKPTPAQKKKEEQIVSTIKKNSGRPGFLKRLAIALLAIQGGHQFAQNPTGTSYNTGQYTMARYNPHSSPWHADSPMTSSDARALDPPAPLMIGAPERLGQNITDGKRGGRKRKSRKNKRKHSKRHHGRRRRRRRTVRKH